MWFEGNLAVISSRLSDHVKACLLAGDSCLNLNGAILDPIFLFRSGHQFTGTTPASLTKNIWSFKEELVYWIITISKISTCHAF